MKDIQQLYNDRVKDVLMTVNHQEPCRVPLGIDVVTWPLAYAGYKLDKENDPEELSEAYVKVFKDLCCDCILDPGVTQAIKVYEALGGNDYKLSEDGLTVQHVMQDYNHIMSDEEYDRLISEPQNFFENVIPRRKYSKINTATKAESYSAMRNAAIELRKHMELNALIERKLKDDLGLVKLWGRHGCSMHKQPFDVIFDGFRGIKGTLIDLRRRPNKVLDAINALGRIHLNEIEQLNDIETSRGKALPFGLMGFKAGPYLGLERIKKYWWPLFIEMYMPYAEAGVKIFVKCEGLNNDCLDLFSEFPKDSIVLQLEEDNPFEVYKKLGDKVTLATGMTTSLLKYGTKEQCYEYIKKTFDTFAPGGGFMFMLDRPLLSGGDANPDTLFSVYEFAKEYGKY
ncbi:MAG: hypothetical protein ACOWWR_12335 [Eubacteriales bacterium]